MTVLALAAIVLQADTVPAHVRAAQLEQAGRPDSARVVLALALERDSTDGAAWRQLGVLLVHAAAAARPVSHLTPQARARTLALIDSAEVALARAAAVGDAPASGYRIFAWGERAILAWTDGGIGAARLATNTVPQDARLPAVLEELGENLLRACPDEGVLLTAREEDSYAVLYLRLVRGLRPDLYLVPLPTWEGDERFRTRVSDELGLGRSHRAGRWLHRLAERRPVCVSMWLDRPPATRPALRWLAHPLIWVAGPRAALRPVPAGEFVFAALRVSLSDTASVWSAGAAAFYRNATRHQRSLCGAMVRFGVDTHRVGCPR